MIKEIISVFKSDSLMDRAYKRSFDMLDLTFDMFLQSKEVLRNTDHNKLDIDIDDQDMEVNKYQREVRKDVFNHLAQSGIDALPSGLVLVSIVIDLERIGDYTKNIVEIAKDYKPRLKGGGIEEDISKIEKAVEENFVKTIDCFKTSNEEEGLELLENYKWVSKLCDQILRGFIRGEHLKMDSDRAVALALYVRSLKRIYSHLRNVTTAVVNPFHRIGYKPKKKKED